MYFITNCDPEKCKAAGCDPVNCTENCENTGTESKICDPTTCPGHAKESVVKKAFWIKLLG
jgi:hypothetical protein